MIRFLIISILWAGMAAAQELKLPGNARLIMDRSTNPDSYLFPTAPFDGDLVADQIEGRKRRQIWRIEGNSLTTLQVLAPLREQLINDGFEIVLECQSQTCGGFDFRFQTDIEPAPDMYVDLSDYRFVSAQRPADEPTDFATVLVSQSSSARFVQLTFVRPSGSQKITVQNSAPVQRAKPTGPLAQNLETNGHVVLNDLVFQTGSSALGDGNFQSLTDLAAYLNEDPSRRVALVGHTDAVGSLDGNIALSKRRAGSVRDHLIKAFGVPSKQMEAEGMGYLSPIATNRTEEGRNENRRVEVILLNTE